MQHVQGLMDNASISLNIFDNWRWKKNYLSHNRLNNQYVLNKLYHFFHTSLLWQQQQNLWNFVQWQFFVKESHVSISGTKQDKKESPMVCDGIWVGFLLSSVFSVFYPRAFVLPSNTSVLNLASICRSWSNNGRGLAQLAIWTDTFTKSLDLPS